MWSVWYESASKGRCCELRTGVNTHPPTTNQPPSPPNNESTTHHSSFIILHPSSIFLGRAQVIPAIWPRTCRKPAYAICTLPSCNSRNKASIQSTYVTHSRQGRHLDCRRDWSSVLPAGKQLRSCLINLVDLLTAPNWTDTGQLVWSPIQRQ